MPKDTLTDVFDNTCDISDFGARIVCPQTTQELPKKHTVALPQNVYWHTRHCEHCLCQRTTQGAFWKNWEGVYVWLSGRWVPHPHPTFQNAPPPLFRAATAKTSDRKACVIIHVQSVQRNFLLVKTHCLHFFTLLKLPNVTNQTDISLLFIALLIIT